MSFEMLFQYSPTQYQLTANVLALVAAVFASAFVYFIVSRTSLAPRYRLTTTLSAVVMVSAFLELSLVAVDWRSTFSLVDGAFVATGEEFSNGYRYMNWSIDVPVLLTQLLIVLGITGAAFRRTWIQFVVGGLAMIWTGYVGQLDEVDAGAQFWIWGGISTVFYLWILFVVGRTILGARDRMDPAVRGLVTAVWVLILVSWTLYPVAYVLPAVWDDAWSAVSRQLIFSVADVTSKAIYGVLLGVIAQKLSSLEGFEPARVQQEATAGRAA